MENDNKFTASGFPSFDDFEVDAPDTKKKHRSSQPDMTSFKISLDADMLQDLDTLNAEKIKSMLPEDVLNLLGGDDEEVNDLVDEVLEQLKETAKKHKGADVTMSDLSSMLLKDLCGSTTLNIDDLDDLGDDELDEEENDEEEDEDLSEDKYAYTYELASTMHLFSSRFGTIECLPDNGVVYHDLVSKLGTPLTMDALVADPSIKNISEDLPKKLDLTELGEVIPVSNEDYYTMCYVKPKEATKFGVYLALLKSPDGSYSYFIPEFRNTFQLTNEDEPRLFDSDRDPAFFRKRSDGTLDFYLLKEEGINFSIRYQLAPVVDRSLIITTLPEFGIIKNIIPPISKQSRVLKVGNIAPNDVELPYIHDLILASNADPNAVTYPVYFHFGRIISEDSLSVLSTLLFSVNLNECPLLKYKNIEAGNGYLYINVDLGDF